MIDTRKEIEQRLSVLCGLLLSDVNRAADMLTLSFGALRPVTNFKGAIKHVGKWALHIQCPWSFEEAGRIVATNADLLGSEEKAYATVDRLREQAVMLGAISVNAVAATNNGGIVVSLSKAFRLVVVPDCIQDAEDWRFFAPSVNAAHLVIKGGAVAPESFD